jgi:hypothetical protein
MKIKVAIIPPKEHNNLPTVYPKDMEIQELPDKEVKIVLRKAQ